MNGESVDTWPTGYLTFDLNKNGQPVNARRIQVVPHIIAQELYDALVNLSPLDRDDACEIALSNYERELGI